MDGESAAAAGPFAITEVALAQPQWSKKCGCECDITEGTMKNETLMAPAAAH